MPYTPVGTLFCVGLCEFHVSSVPSSLRTRSWKGRDKSLCNFVTRFEVESGLLSLTVWPEDGLVVATTKFVALFVLGRGLY